MASEEARAGKGLGRRAGQRAATLIAYFETSAFVELFVDEPWSEAVSRTWRAATSRASSRLSYPEARVALASAVRGGRMEAGVLAEARRGLERLREDVERLEVTDRLTRRAGDLAERYALRGYGAVHLASFEVIADERAVLVTFDDDLRSAASSRGFMVAPRLS